MIRIYILISEKFRGLPEVNKHFRNSFFRVCVGEGILFVVCVHVCVRACVFIDGELHK